jgi:class 3 adenylate cyclase/tetratricopeptide (TPR) repeat protein
VVVCERCGEENPGRARFCLGCGAPLQEASVTERRKLATLLFCDVVGSTELGEGLDPEAVRAQMSAYFSLCRRCIESHGGTVEKFIGDAVMAVFGVPIAHEDDALRAVRAAVAIHEGVSAMAMDSSRRLGRPLRVRIGVASGEVVAGDDTERMTIVTGDPVNVAARLEQAAEPDQVLVDSTTARLVAADVRCVPVGELLLKGKSAPVPGFLVRGSEGQQGRRVRPAHPRAGTAFVGRAAERAALLDAFARAVSLGRGVLVTVVGDAGVGKSRLVDETVAAMPARLVLRGGCPPYGEGMTYYSLRELVTGAGVDLDTVDGFERAVAQIVDETTTAPGPGSAPGPSDRLGHGGGPGNGRAVARILGQALGMAQGVSTPEDIGWAVRRLFQALAAAGPLVVVVDDVQWAEPALVELLLSVARRQRGPVLLVCSARPDLLDGGPAWPAVLNLAPMGGADTATLVRAVLEGALDPRLEEFLVERSGGNPLFAQELAHMLRADGLIRPRHDRGGGTVRWCATGTLREARLPTTLAALLGARLDRTPPSVRRVMECGAVEGEVFHVGAVAALAAGHDVHAALAQLRRDKAVVPDLPVFAEEAAYRFHHLLLRDAAYQALTKSRRADLHGRFADWVALRAGDRAAEFEELIAYHLEQALIYRRATMGGTEDDTLEELRIGRMLNRAGVSAAERGDAAATASLMTRASGYLASVPAERAACLLELGQAQWTLGDLGEADDTFQTAQAIATDAEEPLLAVRARIEQASLAFSRSPDIAFGLARHVLEGGGTAVNVDHPALLARLRLLEALVSSWDGHVADADRATTDSVELARRSGDDRTIAAVAEKACYTWYVGEMPLQEVLDRLDEIRRWAESRSLRVLEGTVLLTVAFAEGERGNLDVAYENYARGERALLEAGADMTLAAMGYGAQVWEAAGDFREAAERRRRALAAAAAHGERGLSPTIAAELARTLCRLGLYDEAFDMTVLSERQGAEADGANTQAWLGVRAMILAHLGRRTEAEKLAARALSLTTEDWWGATTMYDVATVRESLGDKAEARRLAERAYRLFAARGFAVRAELARDMLD